MTAICPSTTVLYIGKTANALGGPGTFISNLESVCQQHGRYRITEDPDCADVYLIVAESVSIRCLWQFWRSDRPIIHRMDGKRTPIRTSLRQARVGHGVMGKLLYGLRLWRSHTRMMLRIWLALLIADGVIYQSVFVKRRWAVWETIRQALPRRISTVITNGVPSTRLVGAVPERNRTPGLKRLTAVKGYFRTGEMVWAVIDQLTDPEFQANAAALFPEYPLIIDVYGHIEGFEPVRGRLDAYKRLHGRPPHVWMHFHDLRPREDVHKALQDPHTVGAMLLEDRPACPNAAFEAQSVGLPVIGSWDGANPEIVIFQELLLDPFQRSPQLFCVQLLKALKFCVDLPLHDRADLQKLFRKAYGDNKFHEYLHFIDFVTQKKTVIQ